MAYQPKRDLRRANRNGFSLCDCRHKCCADKYAIDAVATAVVGAVPVLDGARIGIAALADLPHIWRDFR
ncbi:MAG TPA: hypothetical protein VF928_08905 [Usitatibacteraceae bacterium]